MPEPEIIPLTSIDRFQFACHPQVVCFNHCCRDLNQALTPYDVLRLRSHLGQTSGQFFREHAALHTGPASGLPIASLRFGGRDRACPFACASGCLVYQARPSSCRTYPLMRAVQRRREDGRLTASFALLREPHCRGFDQGPHHTIDRWIIDQGCGIYFEMNDLLLALIALKNSRQSGRLPEKQARWVRMAFYETDLLRNRALAGTLPAMDQTPDCPSTLPDGDAAWLCWALAWLRVVLFGSMIEKQETP